MQVSLYVNQAGYLFFRNRIVASKSMSWLQQTINIHIMFLLDKRLNLYRARYLRMDQVKFVEHSISKIWSDMVCLSRCLSYLPQILLGPFSDTWIIFVWKKYLKSSLSDVFLKVFGFKNSQNEQKSIHNGLTFEKLL